MTMRKENGFQYVFVHISSFFLYEHFLVQRCIDLVADLEALFPALAMSAKTGTGRTTTQRTIVDDRKYNTTISRGSTTFLADA